ncbi:Histidine kinase [Quillaja saponaria]|uniref:histidine kinase n=1 Tax=Quillaja saponaria TaxID=32244 RepID=A0AAD7M2S7_QUISA|nr:Histidine kinase [Quillaja saponaria]
MMQAFSALLVLIALTPCWYIMVKDLEYQVNTSNKNSILDLRSEIEQTILLLESVNASSINLARYQASYLNETDVSFYDVKTKVAPMLFQALVTVPNLVQISYIEAGGLFFSYYTGYDQAQAVYCYSSDSSKQKNLCYIQNVDRDTGELYGEARGIAQPPIDSSWYGAALNSTNGYATLGTSWIDTHELLFLSSAGMNGVGVLSLGFRVRAITDLITSVSLKGGSLFIAAKDGRVLVEGIKDTHMIVADDSVSFQVMEPNGDQVGYVGNVSCSNNEKWLAASILDIHYVNYMVYCSPLDILGVESVYVLAFPQTELLGLVHKNTKNGASLFTAMIFMILISFFSFLFMIGRAAKREMHLCATLIKQMEATQQAERKSMNKSLAFANASHDIRASLAGLTGLIELSRHEVSPSSGLATNLKQMDICTEELLGLLNSILDTSKIEAGKMQLEEEEYDLCQLLEDVVDLYHPVAMKKDVDVVLDPCNGSAIRFSRVKGDRGKLRQILCNLLSNAVKFTDKGHVTVRAWVGKPSFKNSVIASNQNSFIKHLLCLFYKKHEAHDDLKAMYSVQEDQNSMDFVFEVDDTGRGIPKEKQESVFEDYVQVKETGLGQGGTGLGLGIVQSLAHLMHGGIRIMDKDIGEKGTCFRFNVHLAICENLSSSNNTRKGSDIGADRNNQAFGLTIPTPSSGSSICSLSPRLTLRKPSSPNPHASRVVLLIQNEERRRITRKFLESLGIRVSVVKQWDHLYYTLKKIKLIRQRHSRQKSSGKSSTASQNDYLSDSTTPSSSGRIKDVASNGRGGVVTNYIPSIFKKSTNNVGATLAFVLIVIDVKAGPLRELCRVVDEFKRGFQGSCKVVWLETPLSRSINSNDLDQELFDSNDVVISKPFHGTRLYEVIRLLPEFGVTLQRSLNTPTKRKSNTTQAGQSSPSPSSSLKFHSLPLGKSELFPNHELESSRREEIQGSSNSSSESFSILSSIKDEALADAKIKGKNICISDDIHQGEIQECGSTFDQKPLKGKKFLVVEDSSLLRRVAISTLGKLGATADECANGEEAVLLVCSGLVEQHNSRASDICPYDYILMDCQMPVMNGFEATKQIRKMEMHYEVHMPIFALSANASGTAEAKMSMEAGMDFHIVKPLRKQNLLEAIRYMDIRSK